MNVARQTAGTRGRAQELGDYGEIQNLPEAQLQPKLRSQLGVEEERLSLPAGSLPDPVGAALTSALGMRLTADNPVWTGDPVPALRGLQRKLVEHSLTQAEGERVDCMEAISVVEKAVQLRLRWLQMRRSDAEREQTGKQQEKNNEEAGKARRAGS